jgi:hypothetical protein
MPFSATLTLFLGVPCPADPPLQDPQQPEQCQVAIQPLVVFDDGHSPRVYLLHQQLLGGACTFQLPLTRGLQIQDSVVIVPVAIIIGRHLLGGRVAATMLRESETG